MKTTLHSQKDMAMNNRNAGQLLGIAIDRTSLDEAAKAALQAVDRKIPPIVFACANPHSLAVAQQDGMFRAALTQANFVVADGIGVTMMSRLVGVHIGPRITGTDYFRTVLNVLQRREGGRVFFFGSSQRVLDLISARFASEYPSLTLCGTLSPPYGTWSEKENHRMVETINEARPDVLWVGMTAPKQEKWVEANRRQLTAAVIGSIGAVFDFYAGTYSRAPQWICNIGLEWGYRFMLEPRRMWERNFVSAPKFVWLVVRRHVLGC
jgi:N-acetylglucosaminyldiphosphoundecaprenol N-acetyl-beta-D-mannosaminyltransferase